MSELLTIVVVPRERFQFARQSLESLYENTSFPFELVYVDNNSPTTLRRYLEAQAQEKGFKLVRSPDYLSPNQARNFGLRHVDSQYVVFVDNDVIFSPGWLKALVNCTEATGATVVGSLVCQYQPVHEIVHCAGGNYMLAEEYERFVAALHSPSLQREWQIEETTYYQDLRLEEVRDRLHRQQTGFIEFHSMLVRTAIFEQIGWLDEGLPCTKEYIDFAMSVIKAGGTIYLEPSSVVTFLTHPPAPQMPWSDLPYFMLRWSDEWERASLLHLQQKWGLAENKYFQKRYRKLGRRRREELIKPLVARFDFLGKPATKWLEKRLVALEKQLNRYVSHRHRRAIAQAQAISSPQQEVYPTSCSQQNLQKANS
ncbi:MAG: glycosyltransferase family 2 protein [Cyanophyceae cyanobacterium]